MSPSLSPIPFHEQGSTVVVEWTDMSLSTLARVMAKAKTRIKFSYRAAPLGLIEPRGRGYSRPSDLQRMAGRAGMGERSVIQLSKCTVHGGLPDMDMERTSKSSDVFLQFVMYGIEADWMGQTAVEWNAGVGDGTAVSFKKPAEVSARACACMRACVHESVPASVRAWRSPSSSPPR